MARYMITLEDLGQDTCWLLVQQILGMPDPKMQSDFLTDKVALLLFVRQSLPERLCVTAAVRQMSGTTVYQGETGDWQKEINSLQNNLMPVFGFYLDIVYCYGLPVSQLRERSSYMHIPLINAGSPEAHPAHALADVACMIKVEKEIKNKRAAWIGCPNGTLFSLMEASCWFDFSLTVAMPENAIAEQLYERARHLGCNISFAKTAQEAVKGANFIYAGYRGNLNERDLEKWQISTSLMNLANGDAHLLLCASPLRAIPIEPVLVNSKKTLILQQADYRLRLHKRLLHWVFE